MRSRTVGRIITLALTLLWTLLAADGQPVGTVARVGLLRAGAPDLFIEAFRQGLRDLGWVEGHNVVLEYRFAGGQLEQLPNLAAELVRRKVDVIFAPTFPAALAAKHATSSIPVVSAGHADVVEAGLVT